jgi:pimeloyl-ACP methyl ester carboxylesterase/DNA-binding CsgD family transcriptional regulator
MGSAEFRETLVTSSSPDLDENRMEEVGRDLRRGLETGRLGHALLDAGPILGVLADRDPALLAGLMAAASQPSSAGATGAFVEPEAVGFAFIDISGRLIQASERFRDWIDEAADSVDCRGLVRRAALRSRATGCVKTLRHGALAAIAFGQDTQSPWPGIFPAAGISSAAHGVLVVVFAPSRSRALVQRAADSLNLSPLQRRLAIALIDEPTLEAAALSLGIGRETAKDALDGALKRTGARRSSQLVGRLIDLSCSLVQTERLARVSGAVALGLSPAEAGVAERMALGDTAEEAAAALGLRPGTVKSYRRSMFEKLGIHRSRDLRRLMTEAAELDRLSRSSRIDPHPAAEGDLRILTDTSGRDIAYVDHGVARGAPVIVMHGFFTGRLAPPPLVAALARLGRRVIVPHRPGFGLTSPAVGDYVAAGVADLALLFDRLNLPTAEILARDGGAAVALAFGAAYPGRIETGVLHNPNLPSHLSRMRGTPLRAVREMLLRRPALIEPFARVLLRQTSREVLTEGLRRVFAGAECDRACFENAGVADFLLSDLLGLVGRSPTGAIAEQRLFSAGWRIPDPYTGPRWRLALSGGFHTAGEEEVWSPVSDGPPTILAGAGLLAQFTHAESIAALFCLPYGPDTPKRG